jgi:hypothetical protein
LALQLALWAEALRVVLERAKRHGLIAEAALHFRADRAEKELAWADWRLRRAARALTVARTLRPVDDGGVEGEAALPEQPGGQHQDSTQDGHQAASFRIGRYRPCGTAGIVRGTFHLLSALTSLSFFLSSSGST